MSQILLQLALMNKSLTPNQPESQAAEGKLPLRQQLLHLCRRRTRSPQSAASGGRVGTPCTPCTMQYAERAGAKLCSEPCVTLRRSAPQSPRSQLKCHSWSGSAADSLEDGSAAARRRRAALVWRRHTWPRYLAPAFSYDWHVGLHCSGLFSLGAGSVGGISISLISNLEMKASTL